MEIKKDVFWTGAVDWSIRHFHGQTYSVRNGTTYNAYLILDEKITLVDAVHGHFVGEFVENIKRIIPPEKISCIIVNHAEADHTGGLPAIMRLCPKAKIFATQKCKDALHKQYYADWDIQPVKTGDKLDIGKRTLTFIEAAMIHWPDSMFTYSADDKVLFSNDAFGQHYATSGRFDDAVNQCELADETAKYYANILWPFSSVILKKIEEIQKMNVSVDIIAPSHGVIWRKEPKKAMDAYLSWAKNETKPKVVVVFETMYGSTERLATKIVESITDSGIEVRLFDVTKSDRTDVITQMLDAKGYIFGSSTHDNDMLPTMAGFLHFLKGMRPKNRIACAFGSHGWAGGGVKSMEDAVKAMGVELAQPGFAVKYVPDEDEISGCYEYAKAFAEKIKRSSP